MTKNLSVFLLLLILIGSIQNAHSQGVETSGFLRTSIEKYPEPEWRAVLKYLDAAKSRADQAALQLTSGNEKALYAEIERFARQTQTPIDINEMAKSIETTYGKMTDFEYRAQSFVVPTRLLPTLTNPSQGWSEVTYAVRTEKHPKDGLFLVVRTRATPPGHSVFAIQFLEYVENVPPWLRPVKAEKKKPRPIRKPRR